MRRAIPLLLAAAACGEEPRAVVLGFPNADARALTRRLRVEVVENEAVPRTCAEGFLGTAALGEEPAPGRRRLLDERCAEDDTTRCAPDWADGIGLSGLAAQDALVYVRGYASVDEQAPVILEGCSTQFGPGRETATEIELAPVFPATTRLEALSSPRAVLDAGAETTLRFGLRAENPATRTGARRTYGIPAADVVVEVVEGDGSLGSRDQQELSVRTGAEGVVALRFAAKSPGPSRVQARLSGAVEAEIVFTALPPLTLGRRRRVSLNLDPVALALRSEGASALVLSCAGEGLCALPERLPENELLGTAELVVIEDLLASSSLPRTVARELGRLPVDVVALEEGAAVLSARSRGCLPVLCPGDGVCRCEDDQGEVCACERSELALLGEDAGAWSVEARHVSSASTAAALAVLPDPPLRLAVAYRGRIGSTPSCASACDCPFGERCLVESGLCEDRDQEVEILEAGRGGEPLFDGARCSCLARPDSAVVACAEPVPTEAACRDVVAAAPVEDECARLGPSWVPAGPRFTPSFPFDLAFGSVRLQRPDMVVGGLGRVDLVGGKDWLWDHRESRLVNDRLDRVALGQLDPRLDGGADAAGRLDVAFWSTAPCGEVACPKFGSEASEAGCFGVLTTAGVNHAFSVPIDDPAHCRRRGLDVPARAGCLADVDGDGAQDAVTVGASALFVFRGDGAGGLADPGTRVELEGDAVDVACRDLNGDQASEIVVLLAEEPAVAVWGAGAP